MHSAVRVFVSTAVAILVNAGANVNTPNKEKDTPLHLAAGAPYRDNLTALTVLLEAGANVGARNDDGETPLHRVAASGSNSAPRIAETLLDAGADPGAKDRRNMIPWDHMHSTSGIRREDAVYWRLNEGRFQ